MSEFSFNIVTQISVDLSNEPGTFATLTEYLAKANVIILGISVESGYSVSRVHFVVDKPEDAVQVLEGEGERVETSSILAVTFLERKVGQITRIARALADKNINIETIYLTSAAEGTKPTIYISASRTSPEDVKQCLETAIVN